MRVLTVFLISILSFAAHANEFKVLTWNVFMLPKPLKFSKQVERTRLISSQLQKTDYDVVLFQEAFTRGFKNMVKKDLRKKYPYQAELKRSRKIKHLLNSGIYIASKYPLKVLGHHYFKRGTHADQFASKGVLLVEVTLPDNQKVQIASTHTQATDSQKAVSIRAEQSKEIRSFLNLHKRPGVAQILGGDLNVNFYNQREYENMISILNMQDGDLDSHLDYTSGFEIRCYKKTNPSDKAKKLLDYILLDFNGSNLEPLQRQVVEFNALMKSGQECPLSDHHAVEMILRY